MEDECLKELPGCLSLQEHCVRTRKQGQQPSTAAIPNQAKNVLSTQSKYVPPEVHPAFGTSCYVSACDAAGHGFKPQW